MDCSRDPGIQVVPTLGLEVYENEPYTLNLHPTPHALNLSLGPWGGRLSAHDQGFALLVV